MKIMKISPLILDGLLYLGTEEAVFKALSVAKALNDCEFNEKTDFFMYWDSDNLTEKHEYAIKSFLTTQDLSICRLNIYSSIDLSNHPILVKLKHPEINVKMFDVESEAKGTPLENSGNVLMAKNNQIGVEKKADLFRILMLYKYGGVYVDFDTLFLRDFRPILNYEFCYQWGGGINNTNNAIMRFKKQSKIATDSITTLYRMDSCFGALCFGQTILDHVKSLNSDFLVFPCCFFDSDWQGGHERQINAFRAVPFNLHDGAFAWHWHNKWNDTIESGSKFDFLRTKIDLYYNFKFIQTEKIC